jgi:hypothetical protein
MKKILLIAAVAFAFTACKKDYTCECTVTTSGQGVSGTATGSTTVKDTKKKAKDSCEEGTKAATTVGGITTETKCAIK